MVGDQEEKDGVESVVLNRYLGLECVRIGRQIEKAILCHGKQSHTCGNNNNNFFFYIFAKHNSTIIQHLWDCLPWEVFTTRHGQHPCKGIWWVWPHLAIWRSGFKNSRDEMMSMLFSHYCWGRILCIMKADHCYGLGVQSPVGSVSWLRFFLGFFLNWNTNVRKFGPHSSLGIIWPS